MCYLPIIIITISFVGIKLTLFLCYFGHGEFFIYLKFLYYNCHVPLCLEMCAVFEIKRRKVQMFVVISSQSKEERRGGDTTK